MACEPVRANAVIAQAFGSQPPFMPASHATWPAVMRQDECCTAVPAVAPPTWSFILSNSSIRQTPLSASTRAPPSSVHSLVTGSLCTPAVRPTALAPLPAWRQTGRWLTTCLYFAERLPSRQEGPHSAAATAQTAAQHCRLYTNDLLSLLSIFEHCCEAVPALTSAASPIKTIIVLGSGLSDRPNAATRPRATPLPVVYTARAAVFSTYLRN